MDNISKYCSCSGTYQTLIDQSDIMRHLKTFSIVAKYFKMPLLSQMVEWMIKMNKGWLSVLFFYVQEARETCRNFLCFIRSILFVLYARAFFMLFYFYWMNDFICTVNVSALKIRTFYIQIFVTWLDFTWNS